MALERNCAACGGRVMIPDALAGKPYRCPTCGAVSQADGGGVLTQEVDQGLSPNGEAAPDAAGKIPLEPETMQCPACFENIPANAEKCHFCGSDPRLPPRREPLPPPVRRDCEPHRGNLILAMGVISLVFMPCGYLGVGIVLGAIAWALGRKDLAKIRAGDMDPDGEGATNAGKICGIVGVVTNSFMAICMCLYLGAVMGWTFSMRSSAVQIKVNTSITTPGPPPATKRVPAPPEDGQPTPPPSDSPPAEPPSEKKPDEKKEEGKLLEDGP